MIQEILTTTDTICQTFVFNGYANLVSAYTPAIISLVCIAIGILGYAILNGWVQLSLAELSKRVLIFGFVLTLSLNWSFFSEYVYDFFTNAPNEIATHIIESIPGANYSSQNAVYTALETAFNEGIGFGLAAIDRASIPSNLTPILWGLSIWISTIIFTILAVGELVFVKCAMAIYLVLAPIIIPTFMFPTAKSMVFDGWLKHLVAFSLVPIYLMCAIALSLLLMSTEMNAIQGAINNDSVTISTFAPFMIYAGIAIILVISAAFLAVSMAGGVSVGISQKMSGFAGKFSSVRSG